MGAIEPEHDTDAARLWMYEADLSNIIEVVRETKTHGKLADLKNRCLNNLERAHRQMNRLQKTLEAEGR
jgi:hypothetical protein